MGLHTLSPEEEFKRRCRRAAQRRDRQNNTLRKHVLARQDRIEREYQAAILAARVDWEASKR